MKKVIAWLLVLALTAAISIGATLAYLTDTDEDVNVMTLGKVMIDQLEYERIDTKTADKDATVQIFHDNKPLLPAVTDKSFNYTPGDTYVDWDQIGKDGYTSDIWDPAKINNEVDKMVFVKNKGDYDAYVRSVFAFEAGKYTTLDQFRKMVHLNLNETDWTWKWEPTPVKIGESTYFIATATYNKVLAPGALTEISLSQIALDSSATNEDVEAFGDTYQVLVKSQGIQADGFEDPDFALNEGFGPINGSNVPWTTDQPPKGVDLKTALHYLNGQNPGTKITDKVTNVTFGLTDEFASVADGYTGTLVTDQQDVPVYAYYVPEGSNYDVYVLADSTIYTPKDSSELFYGMKAMQTLNTDNVDFGRTESMFRMFRECSSLQALDVSDWDTSNVVNMGDMFRQCASLTKLDASSWDVSKVTNLYCTFYNCPKLAELNVSTWDTGNVTDMAFLFRDCPKLTTLDVANWDVSSAELLRYMFYNCTNLQSVDVSKWNTGSATKLDFMFSNCPKLTQLDLSKWNVSNVTTTKNMFYGCTGITSLDFSDWNVGKIENFEAMFGSMSNLTEVKMDNWQPTSAETMYSLFYECKKLQSANMNGWKMPNLTTTSHMFRGCNNMTSVDVSGWYTPSLTSMDAMFHTCKALTEVDLSSFDTSNCTELSQIFDYATGIKRVKGLENWDTSSCKTFEQTFAGCYALEELNLSSFNTRNVVNEFSPMQNGATGRGYKEMFSDMSNRSLKKLILGENFSFDGDGKVFNEDYKVSLPSPAAKEGYIGKWQNVETGVVYDASEIPEETAATYVAYYEYASKGAKLKDALHYLNANPSGTKISANVTNVIFGRNKDYADIVNNYTGVLADQEQDGPVYAYYVPNGSNFDVYLLANDDIYLPKDSFSLMAQMTALTKVDTTNLNVSRTENMHRLFYKSGALQTIVGLENWDTGSVTNMLQLFRESGIKGDLDLTAWDVSNVVNMEDLFYKCGNITSLNLENWDTTACTNIGWAFGCASELKSINVSGWDTSNVTLMPSLFYECLKLETLDLTDWDTSKVTDTRFMFIRCRSLKEIVGSGNLNFRNVKNMESMCEGLDVMVTLDVTNWGCDSVTNMKQMFGWALSMEDIIGIENWNVSNVTNMRTMFYCCPTFEELDLSGWNTASLQNTYRMFRDCTGLKTVYVGDGWNVSHVSDAGEMFTNCSNLVGGAGTTFVGTDLKYACVDGGAEAPGYLTYKAAE